MGTGSGIITFHEIISTEYPNPKAVVKGIINSGETVLFIARQKEGKSTLVYQLALDVACGDKFLGNMKPTRSLFCTSTMKITLTK
jgi:RecA-family ATPase